MATNVVFVDLTVDGRDKLIDEMSSLPYMPNELVAEIASCMENAVDIANMRLVNKRFSRATRTPFFKAIANSQVIYPRYDCFRNFLSLLNAHHVLPNHVRNIVLVAEGLKEHEHGYAWAWEDLANWENIDITAEDMAIINNVNQAHADDLFLNGPFLNSGSYRAMLTMLLSRLPKLCTINIRPLRVGEHCPGWDGPEALKKLSFYRKDLNTNAIFYGDWKYDTLHLRVTVHKDEFGDEIIERGAGPQASFRQDLMAAFNASGTSAMVFRV